MRLNVSSAVHPHFLLVSTCSDVKSNSRGADSRPCFCSISVMDNSLALTFSNAALADASSLYRPTRALNVASRYTVLSSQKSSDLNASISLWRCTMMASVGVCTLPIDSTLPLPEVYFSVYSRVAFIPNIQSPMARDNPAWYNGSKSACGRRFLNPSRMASSVSDDIHNRFTGHWIDAFCITHRCISSPSCPASPQLITSSASLIRLSMTLNCFSMLSWAMSLMANLPGIMGSCASDHRFHNGV